MLVGALQRPKFAGAKTELLKFGPMLFWTSSGPAKVASEGTVATSASPPALTDDTGYSSVLTITRVADVNPSPLIVIASPGFALAGANEVMLGPCANRRK